MVEDTLIFPATESHELSALGRLTLSCYGQGEMRRICVFSPAAGAVTDTESLLGFMPESDLVPHEYCFASGAVSFWDNEAEDIYSFEDGQAI
jgi:hypothetical protein